MLNYKGFPTQTREHGPLFMEYLEVDSINEGDALLLLQQVLPESVDLVYLDPPFFTQRSHVMTSKGGVKEYKFEDSWASSDEYVSFMRDRLLGVRNAMKETASIYLHCDSDANYLLRPVLEDIFGRDNFRSEIIWTYKRWSNSARNYLPAHQTIFFYTKSKNYTFNQVFTEYSASTNIDQILQLRQRDPKGKSKYQRNKQGEVQYAEGKKGVPLSDTWDIPYLNPKAKERTGYPTQKPLLLLERIIEISSNAGDLVLDPFSGSGTTVVAAKSLGRHYIGIDKNPDAISLAEQRILNPIRTKSNLMENGRESYNLAHPLVAELLSGLNYIPVQRNSGIDAFLTGPENNLLVPLRIQRQGELIVESVAKLKKAAETKNIYRGVVLRTGFEPSLVHEPQSYGEFKVLNTLNLSILGILETPN